MDIYSTTLVDFIENFYYCSDVSIFFHIPHLSVLLLLSVLTASANTVLEWWLLF